MSEEYFYGTLHQKRYFAFLCYRRLFLLHKPGVKMMTLGLFHFSHWSAIITATEYEGDMSDSSTFLQLLLKLLRLVMRG